MVARSKYSRQIVCLFQMFVPSFQILRRGNPIEGAPCSETTLDLSQVYFVIGNKSTRKTMSKSVLLGTIFPDSKSFYIQQYYDSATRPHVVIYKLLVYFQASFMDVVIYRKLSENSSSGTITMGSRLVF